MKLLLLSNSTNSGEAYLGWPRQYIQDFFNKHQVSEVLFIPYAGVNLSNEDVKTSYDIYETKVSSVFSELGIKINSIHKAKDPIKAVENAKAIAVGGGNTFHLVHELHTLKLIEPIRERVRQGMPFAGWSAGSNVACPTMKTTNDMPIIDPPSFNCLNLIPFQINPHYLDKNPEGHGGETRQQRLEEFMFINRDIYVVGLREGTLLEVEENKIELKGDKPLVVFKHGQEPQNFAPFMNIDFLLK